MSNTKIVLQNVVKPVVPDEIGEQFKGVLGTLSSFKSQLTMLQNQVRGLEKSVNKKMKAYDRAAKKHKNKGNRKPSGFAVPTKISDALCKFMKKPNGSTVARTEVTQYIIKYISDNKLQWKENRKVIKPNDQLKTLLKVKKDQEVTYFTIQKLMNQHFIRAQ